MGKFCLYTMWSPDKFENMGTDEEWTAVTMASGDGLELVSPGLEKGELHVNAARRQAQPI